MHVAALAVSLHPRQLRCILHKFRCHTRSPIELGPKRRMHIEVTCIFRPFEHDNVFVTVVGRAHA